MRKSVGLLFALLLGNTASCGSTEGALPAGGSAEDGGNTSIDGGSASVDGGEPGVPEPACAPLAGAPAWKMLEPGLHGLDTPSTKPGYEPQFAGLLGVAYGSGRFVALGNAIGTASIRWATSEDGETWTEHEQPNGVVDTLFSTESKVHFVNGRFVFFATHTNEPYTSSNGGAFVYTSDDGASWKGTRIEPTAVSVTEFDASPSLTVTAGRNGDMRSSPDLDTWTVRQVSQGQGFSFNDIAYGGGRWVATINGGGEVFGSADGATWTKLDGIAGAGGYTVEYGNGVWIAQGRTFHTSTDGVTFVETTPTGAAFGTAARFAGGRFVSYVISYTEPGNPVYFRTSVDGRAWEEFGGVPPIDAGGVFSDIAYGNCKYVAAGQYVKNDVRQALIAVVDAPPPTK